MFYPVNYAEYVQYPIATLIFILSFLNIKKIRKTDLILVSLLILLGSISYSIGKFYGYPSNIRAILVPIIFIVVYNSNSYKYLKPFFILCLLVVIIESALFYFGLSFWRHITRGRDIIGFSFLRPYGLFFDDHSTSMFLAISFFCLATEFWAGLLLCFQ